MASKSEEQLHAHAKANAALAEAVKAEQAVETTGATADREKQIALISASREPEQKAIAGETNPRPSEKVALHLLPRAMNDSKTPRSDASAQQLMSEGRAIRCCTATACH